MALKVGIKPFRKLQAMDKYIERKHKELAPNEHWYLALLAVDPKYQGQGYASRLLNEMLSDIDEEDLLCNLETDNDKNVSMYQHFGFIVVDEFIVPGTKEKVVAMLRKSKAVNNEDQKSGSGWVRTAGYLPLHLEMIVLFLKSPG
ncbi:GNAT family N-acetyltransferase [Chloroflexota bacterium]